MNPKCNALMQDLIVQEKLAGIISISQGHKETASDTHFLPSSLSPMMLTFKLRVKFTCGKSGERKPVAPSP